MYFDSDCASVEYNEEAGVAELTWKNFGKGDNFRIPCLKTLELLKEKKARFWFSNTEKLPTMAPEDAQWFIETMVPAILEAGVKEQALVVPESVISKLTLNKATALVDERGLKTHYFKTREEALEWLKSHKNS